VIDSDEGDLPQNTFEMAESSDHAGRQDVAGRGDSARFFTFRRLWPLVVIAVGIGTFFGLGLDRYVTFDTLKENRVWLKNLVSSHWVLSTVGFITIYAAVAGLSLPGATVVSISGGFLFGLWYGTAWNVIGATIGASLLFLAARTVLGDVLYRKVDPWLERMDSNFEENSFSYLLFLRLVPLFPFFVVNLVPAFVGVSFRTFAITTFVGIIPGAFVYTSVGAGLGSVFDEGQEFTIWTPEILAGLVGLGILSLLPVAIKFWRTKRTRS
jgi:uncharacterized membrane protein YdjX (TVP38/TMEM64 family)